MQFLGLLAVVVTLFVLVSSYPTAAIIIGVLIVLIVVAFRFRVTRPARRVAAPDPKPVDQRRRVLAFRTSDLRATDHDRELTAGVLTSALRDGSLTVSEYSERCGAAGAAQLRRQLFGCVRDLDF